jgi:hypothetical protein
MGIAPAPPATTWHGEESATDPWDLDATLERCRTLAAQASRALAISLGLAELGTIDLPDVTPTSGESERVRFIVPLYLAAELERAQVVPAAEALTALYANGGLAIELGPGRAVVLDFWRTRHLRFSAAERAGLYGQLFGAGIGPPLVGPGGRQAPLGHDFELVLTDLNDLVANAEPLTGSPWTAPSPYSPPSAGPPLAPHQPLPTRIEAGLRFSLRQVIDLLADRSGGLPELAARELLATTSQALEIFKLEGVQRALGARSVWSTVQRVAQRYLGSNPNVGAHVMRAKSGVVVLDWVIGAAERLALTARLSPPPDEVVSAAFQWLQASLDLLEGAPGAPS